MTLALVGGTHRTVPIGLREKLAFSAEQAAQALARFRERFPGREGVLLSTCNRVEFYAAGENDAAAPAHEQIVSFLAECRGIDAATLGPCCPGSTMSRSCGTCSMWPPGSTAWCSASPRSSPR